MSLSEYFTHESGEQIAPSSIAFTTIDIQNIFCQRYPKFLGVYSNPVQKEIDSAVIQTQKLLLSFKMAGLKILHIRAGVTDKNDKDFYKIPRDPRDIIVTKESISAFNEDSFGNPQFSSNIEGTLTYNRIKGLIVSGFYSGLCVKETVKGALRRGYKVAVVEDATANGWVENKSKHLYNMANAGAFITNTEDSINYSRQLRFG